MDITVVGLSVVSILLTVFLIVTLRQYRLVQNDHERLQHEIDEDERLLSLCREQARELLDTASETEIERTAIERFNATRQAEIAHRKQTIIEKLTVVGTLQTHEVADLLAVSRTTAYRYLQELVEASKLVQVGEDGPAVHYELPKA